MECGVMIILLFGSIAIDFCFNKWQDILNYFRNLLFKFIASKFGFDFSLFFI